MRTIEDIRQMRGLCASERAVGRKIVFVPTMGFLHRGHQKLLETGRALGGMLVLSIFVNPKQFGPHEDYGAYPRDLERDSRMAEDAGVDVLFAPKPGQMYPDGFRTTVDVTGLSSRLCGETRPGHFAGVATVVLKLFNIVLPHAAIFGKKDYQQFVILKRMVEDLSLDVEMIGVETVRDDDGVALSSRNTYLSIEERKTARRIPECIEAAKMMRSGGVAESGVIVGALKKIIEKDGQAVVDYIRLCDTDTLDDVAQIKGKALLALAVRIGRARLIDNCILE